MRFSHTPKVSYRYWLAITLASLFGTNLGDLYAHELGLGLYRGLALLAALAALVFWAESRDRGAPRLAYYWLVIVIIRTGATNIADFLAYRARVPGAVLCLWLAAIIAGFGALAITRRKAGDAADMPRSDAAYWIAMLGAGVFGTALGDICSHLVGEGWASLALTGLLLATLAIWRGLDRGRIWLYWIVVAAARTAGTAMGDWLAESPVLGLGLPLSTMITGAVFLLCSARVAARPTAPVAG